MPASPPWTVSRDAAGAEAIVASKGVTTLLRGRAATRVLQGEDPARVAGRQAAAQLRVDWPAAADILADYPVPGATDQWGTAEELGRLVGRSGAPAYVLIAAAPAAAIDCLGALSTRLGRAITPVLVHGELLVIGPTFIGDRWPCRRCWASRLVANLPAFGARVTRGHTVVTTGQEARIADCFTTARTLWEAGAPQSPRDRALVVDLERGTLAPERILPTAACPCLHPGEPAEPEELVGRCFGSIHSVGSPSHPFGAGLAVVTACSRQGPEAGIGGAAAGVAGHAARLRAVAETIERLAAESTPPGAYRAPVATVVGAPALSDLHPYTYRQYRTPGFPYRALEPDSLIDWVDGMELLTGVRRPVPLAVVTFRGVGPTFAARSSTGRAAGRSWPSAVEKALLEVAERDVVTRRWCDGDAVELGASEWAPAERRAAASAALDVRLASCADDDVPVAVAAVVDRRTGLGALGSAAGATFAQAAPHAVEEAALMHAHRSARGSLLPVADVWFAAESLHPRPLLEAMRPDELLRRYRPVAVDLTTREASAAGLAVAAVWSPTAVDFPRPGEPLPLARWVPSDLARRRVAATPGAFAGDGDPGPHPEAAT